MTRKLDAGSRKAGRNLPIFHLPVFLNEKLLRRKA
jgi:hypothetical protein